MRYRILFLLTSLFSVCFSTDQELFLRAKKLYMSGDVDQAAGVYSGIQKKNRAVFYNLGNCYYEQKEYPSALACWMRAQKGATKQEVDAIENAIAKAEKAIGKKHTYSVSHYASSYMRRLVTPIPFLSLELLFLAMWCCLWWCTWRRRPRKYKIFTRYILMAGVVVVRCVHPPPLHRRNGYLLLI